MHPTSRELTRSARLHLDAAEGWLKLGNCVEATEELNRIPPRFRGHADVLHICYHLWAASGKWDMAAAVARSIARVASGGSYGFVKLAYLLHELKRTREARDVLLPIVHTFPNDCLLRYNLACCECQLGNLSEARDWLLRAFELPGGSDLRQGVLEDPDLQPLFQQAAVI